MEHSPHTVLRQMLRESIVLLRHSEVALVFRFFSGGSSVSKGFLCATAFFPLSSSEVAPFFYRNLCKLSATDARLADISEENLAIDQCQINNCKTSEWATFSWQLLQSIS